MSGLNENLNSGKKSLDGSSSRRSAAQGGDANPGELLRKSSIPVGPPEVPDSLSLKPETIKSLIQSRDYYDSWIASLVPALSKVGQALIKTNFLGLLKEVPNSTTTYSRVLAHVDVTRWDHCIHAAHSVQVLNSSGRLGLTPYETTVLELVMLLHDPHRKGSHALDRVFASMPGAPKNFNKWWAKDDYHEYHGAKSVATEPTLRAALGKYGSDVLAILAYDDKRSKGARRADYGESRPRLTSRRIEALYHLKDELDRCSYLELDYLRSGFKPEIVSQVIADVERHKKTLSARGSCMQINIDRESGSRPYDAVARWRHLFREAAATLPIGCLAEKAIFLDGVWEKALSVFTKRQLQSSKLYEFVRDAALKGEYHKIFSEDALARLNAAESRKGLTVEDVYAPLVTMTLADFSESNGRRAVDECIPPGLAEQFCGVPRKDMTLLEAGIRRALYAAGLDRNVHVLVTNDFRKRLTYSVSRDGAKPVEEVVYTDCQPSMIQVIVAARAIDKEDQTIDLSRSKRVVHEFLRDSGYLKNPAVINKPNPRVFCEPVNSSVFAPQTLQKMNSVVPEWIKRGGCGLSIEG